MGTGLRSGTARFLTGSLPSAPWEVRFSALQTHEGHHLLQLKGQPLFPGCIVLLQCAHNLPAWPWKRHTTLLLKALNRTLKIQQITICVTIEIDCSYWYTGLDLGSAWAWLSHCTQLAYTHCSWLQVSFTSHILIHYLFFHWLFMTFGG